MLNPEELPLNERKRLLGMVYLSSVAAVVGYGADEPRSDYDSIDLIISSRTGRRRRLDFQVKCTAGPTPEGEDFGFELSKKNYDELRIDSIMPRFLFVLIVPEQLQDVLRHSERRMNFRRSGYWLSLKGMVDLPNTSTVTVRIPRRNQLTPSSLRDLMMQEVST